MSFINGESLKVFVSYSHDSPEHLERVLRLSDRLRRDGIDCIIDQYEISPRAGWPRWTMSQVEEARFVLVACSETYHRRVRGKEETGKGLGANWEGAIISQELYDSEANNDKFIPLLFSSEDAAHIPVYLRGATHYVLNDDYEDLYRQLTNQPKHLKPALGTLRSLPPRDRKEDFLPMPESQAAEGPAGVGSTPNPPTASQSRKRAIWIVGALAGFAAIGFMLLWWFRPHEPPDIFDPPPFTNCHVHITVLDLHQAIVNDAVITSSVGDKPKKIDDGWEIDISAASRPADGKVILSASKPDASLYGQKELTLNAESNLAIKIQLTQMAPPNPPHRGRDHAPSKPVPSASEDTSVHIKGTVVDSSSQPIAGVLVYVDGHKQEGVRTGSDGKFDLAAYKAEGEIVHLYAKREGFELLEQYPFAGSKFIQITFE